MTEVANLMSQNSASREQSNRLAKIGGVPDFWELVQRAPHRLLALDYDGTLAPFHVERNHSQPLDGVPTVLQHISSLHGTSVAILSGRPAGDVIRLIGRNLHLPIIGEHGYDRVEADGQTKSYALSERQSAGLVKAMTIAVNHEFLERLERKTASVAFHTRGFADFKQAEIRICELWKPLTAVHDLRLMHFNGGVEIVAATRNKGVALAELYAEMPPRTLAVYIGDDATDEDAFHIVRSIGIGVKVGGGKTQATGSILDEHGVLAVLREWVGVMGARDS